MLNLFRRAEALCPVCLQKLPAEIWREGDDYFLLRHCPDHGRFKNRVWSGPPFLESWQKRAAAPAPPGLSRQTALEKGCPHDCGRCPGHRQQACTVLFEITGRCNLACPVCFADAGASGGQAELPELFSRLEWAAREAGPVVLQLSGGEPTLHPELPSLVRRGAELFPAVQLNTNGLKLAEEPGLARELAAAGLSWVFLQFDGAHDDIHRTLRGRPLLAEKMAALESCRAAGLAVVLVVTVARGVNDGHLGELLRLGLREAPTVRGLHLQPMTLAGRNRLTAENRLTLPEVLRAICEQSRGLMNIEDAVPPNCEHERCSFHCRYRLRPDGRLEVLRGQGACCAGRDGGEGGVGRAIDTIRRVWGAPPAPEKSSPRDAFEAFINQARAHTFSVTAMAFQDAWTADLERLSGCCVQVESPDRRLMPFCAYNLTNAAGQPLHRRPR